MISSPHNEKLKLVRKLRERRQRDREGLFASEGEDLLEAGLAAGAAPRFVLVAAGSGLAGEEVEPQLLAEVSTLGSGHAGDRGLAAGLGGSRWRRRASTCTASATPATSATIVRSAHALLGGTVALGPDCADPFGPKAVRASMGSIFGQPLARAGVEATPRPRAALVAHGGAGLEALDGAATLCLGGEREGLPADALAECDAQVTIPLRPGGAESLNVAAAAAIAAQWISSLAMRETAE